MCAIQSVELFYIEVLLIYVLCVVEHEVERIVTYSPD